MTPSAAIYLRVSTVEQLDGRSMAAQRRELEAHCERRAFEVVAVYEDAGVSAHSDQISRRPGLSRLLADAQAGRFDVAVVHTLDRWARSVVALWQTLAVLGKAGVGFESVLDQVDYSTPDGRLMMTIKGGFAEHFSHQLAVHVAKGQRQRVATGLPIGPLPWGYQSAGDAALPPVIGEREAKVVREVFVRRAAGASNASIAAWMNGLGLRTRADRIISGHWIKDMLRCRFYVGVVTYRGEEYAGQHAAVVDEALWERAQRRRHPRQQRRRDPRPLGALRGRVACAGCGHPLHCETNASGRVYYRERHACDCPTNGRAVSATRIDAAVGEWLSALRLPRNWRQRIERTAAAGREGAGLDALKEQRRRLSRAFADGAFTDSEYGEKLAEVDARIAGAGAESVPDLQLIAALCADVRRL